jgi:oxygen-independent coproporphyrinogen-3 oxidase
MRGIYIHIPFCAKKCAYCDFFSVETTQYTNYTKSLISSILGFFEGSLRGTFLQKSSPQRFSTIYIGGGTPTILPLHLLTQIITSLPPADEFTIEANPGTVDEKYLHHLRALGVNRLSLGAQSMSPRLLSAIGRIHSRQQFFDTYNAARRAGFDNINIDLMFALPGQTLEDWLETLGEVIALAPQHISCYALTPAEGTPMADYRPDEALDRDMYHAARVLLAKNGYTHYEISNWARPGFECRHNVDCWQMRPYIGFGAGAAGFDGVYRTETSQCLQSWRALEKIPADIETERIILGLRMLRGLPRTAFSPAHEKALTSLISSGLLAETSGNIALTLRGLDFANTVFAEFI